jgi:hypothetical protein
MRGFIAPGVEAAFAAAASSPLPFCFSGKPVSLPRSFREPFGVCVGIEPTDAGHRLIRMIEFRITPCCWYRVSRFLCERSVLLVGDRETTHGKGINIDSVNRSFVICAGFAAHREFTGRDYDHFRFDVQKEIRHRFLREGMVEFADYCSR